VRGLFVGSAKSTRMPTSLALRQRNVERPR